MANASHNSKTIMKASGFVNSFQRCLFHVILISMERIAALVLAEHDRLEWRKRLTGYFRMTGDWTAYAMPPSILLPGMDSIDDFIDAGDGIFRHEGNITQAMAWQVLRIDDERLASLSSCPGLFISRSAKILPYTFCPGDVKVSDLALFELDGYETRIIRRRPLRLSPAADV